MRAVCRALRSAACWVLVNCVIGLPIIVLCGIARVAEALVRGIAWLVDDRAWSRWIFATADRIETWAKRGAR